MTKYILIWGHISKAPDGGKSFCEEMIKGIKNKPIKILDCMFASPENSWSEDIKKSHIFFSKHLNDFELELADISSFTEQVRYSDIIFLRWWYVSSLLEILSKNKAWIKALDGKVLVGTSAGADVIAKYYYVLKTLRTGDGLWLLPIKFIPHRKTEVFDGIEQHIDFDKIIKELKDYKEDLPIVTLKEWEFIVF